MSIPQKISGDDRCTAAPLLISFLSFHHLLEGLKWAAFVTTLGLLYVQLTAGSAVHYS